MMQRQKQTGRSGSHFGWLWLCLALLLPIQAFSADSIKVVVTGVDGVLRDNVMSYVGPMTANDLRAWPKRRLALEGVVYEAMESMGYYNPKVTVEQYKGEVRINVSPGQPIRVGHLRLVFLGEAGNDIAFTALRESLPLKEGDIFHHGNYENLKSAIQSLALERGYFSAEWVQHEVVVDPDRYLADIDVVYSSGRRFSFGPVSFEDMEGKSQTLLRPDVLASMVPFEEGEPFDAGGIIKLNRSLLDTRYFSEVRVRQQSEGVEPLTVPVKVQIAEGLPNDIDAGVGYSTDVEGRISLTWRRPLINDRGHGVRASTELSQVRRSFDSVYSIPWTHPLDDVIQLLYGVQREDVESVVTYNTVLGVQRQIQREQSWKRTFSLRWSRESFQRPDGVDGKSDLLLPGFSIDRVRSKGGVDPYWGDRKYYQTELASSQLLSDADFITLRAGLRLLRTVADKHQFLLRADGGAIIADRFEEVPLTMRFYAGGDQSVRGYDYKSLSPRDANGIAVGARYLTTGSAEYDYTFYPRWRLAFFSDIGNAFDSVSEQMKVGSGLGIRWVSPVGPIRLDLAWAVSEPGKDFRVHFSMGPNL